MKRKHIVLAWKIIVIILMLIATGFVIAIAAIAMLTGELPPLLGWIMLTTSLVIIYTGGKVLMK